MILPEWDRPYNLNINRRKKEEGRRKREEKNFPISLRLIKN
ncbi:hypothetical protein [Phormidium nigroviride]